MPAHLRYLPENIYLVGVIPGHPSTDRINQFLEPLVDELDELWKGVHFTRTAATPEGRRVRAALGLVICDMLAARQVSGFSSATSTAFCTRCILPISDIDNVDPETWPPRRWETMKNDAEQWRLQPTDKDREAHFKKHHVRWSALNRLPYWDAVACVVPDSLHFSLLGLAQDHCRTVWGINVNVEGGFGERTSSAVRPPDDVLLSALHKINEVSADAITDGFAAYLKGISHLVLMTICSDNGLPYGGKRKALIQTIADYVSVELTFPLDLEFL